jgi:hypothetical protein
MPPQIASTVPDWISAVASLLLASAALKPHIKKIPVR